MFWKVLSEITHTVMVFRYMDVREKNRVINSGAYRKFCNSKYIKTPIYQRKSIKK